MAEETTIKRALISVHDKKGIDVFARGLQDLGWKIVSSGGTAKFLAEQNIEVTDVAFITGVPPILDHRVVTLHPKIHGGILAEQTPEHELALEQYGIPRFNLVCVGVYPVWEALADPYGGIAKVVELTDIGGPAMLRAAAKNHQNVIVICEPDDRQRILTELQAHGDIDIHLRRQLAQKVFSFTSEYDKAIANFYALHNGASEGASEIIG